MSLTAKQMKEIDRSKEQLVQAAEDLLTDAQVVKFAFGHSQLRNLLAVASETDSPKVVVNFIRYQMGRDDKRKNWSRIVKGDTLGNRLIDQIAGDGGAVSTALARLPEIDDSQVEQLARIELIRQFIGFASRHLKFVDLKPKKGGKR